MGFKDLFRKAKEQPKTLPMVSFISSSLGSLFGAGADSRASLEEYKGWVYACVRAIAEDAADIQLFLAKDDAVVESHEVLTLLNSVNRYMTFRDLAIATQSYLELDGNAFWWIVRQGGQPVGIWPLRPDWIGIVPDEKTYIKEYVYTVGNKKYKLDASDVLHFREFNPTDAMRGFGVTSAAKDAILSDAYARLWNKEFFKNSARPDVVLEYPGNLSKPERDQLERKWKDRHKGVEKAHGLSILEGGAKIHTLGVSQRDMEFSESRRFSRDEILALFNVPRIRLGLPDDFNRATAETAEWLYMKNTIKPRMQRFVDTLNERLLPMLGIDGVRFDFDDPTPQNREMTLQEYENGLKNGWLSVNDVRRREGLPEITGGESVMKPLLFEPLGEPVKQIAPARFQPKTPAQKVARDLASVVAPIAKQVYDTQEFERRGLAVWKATTAKADRYEETVAGKMDDYFADQKKRALEAFDEAFAQKAAKATAPELLDAGKESGLLSKLLAPFFALIVDEQGNTALEDLGIDAVFSVQNERIRRSLDKKIEVFAGGISEETTKRIREQVAAGLEAREDTREIRKRVENLAGFDRARSELIARTEVARMQSFATLEAWRESGVVEGKIWWTAEDERVEEECAALHGQEFGLGATIAENDYETVKSPPLHPRCRCVLLPIVASKAVQPAAVKQVAKTNILEKLEELDRLIEKA